MKSIYKQEWFPKQIASYPHFNLWAGKKIVATVHGRYLADYIARLHNASLKGKKK